MPNQDQQQQIRPPWWPPTKRQEEIYADLLEFKQNHPEENVRFPWMELQQTACPPSPRFAPPSSPGSPSPRRTLMGPSAVEIPELRVPTPENKLDIARIEYLEDQLQKSRKSGLARLRTAGGNHLVPSAVKRLNNEEDKRLMEELRREKLKLQKSNVELGTEASTAKQESMNLQTRLKEDIQEKSIKEGLGRQKDDSRTNPAKTMQSVTELQDIITKTQEQKVEIQKQATGLGKRNIELVKQNWELRKQIKGQDSRIKGLEETVAEMNKKIEDPTMAPEGCRDQGKEHARRQQRVDEDVVEALQETIAERDRQVERLTNEREGTDEGCWKEVQARLEEMLEAQEECVGRDIRALEDKVKLREQRIRELERSRAGFMEKLAQETFETERRRVREQLGLRELHSPDVDEVGSPPPSPSRRHEKSIITKLQTAVRDLEEKAKEHHHSLKKEKMEKEDIWNKLQDEVDDKEKEMRYMKEELEKEFGQRLQCVSDSYDLQTEKRGSAALEMYRGWERERVDMQAELRRAREELTKLGEEKMSVELKVEKAEASVATILDTAGLLDEELAGSGSGSETSGASSDQDQKKKKKKKKHAIAKLAEGKAEAEIQLEKAQETIYMLRGLNEQRSHEDEAYRPQLVDGCLPDIRISYDNDEEKPESPASETDEVRSPEVGEMSSLHEELPGAERREAEGVEDIIPPAEVPQEAKRNLRVAADFLVKAHTAVFKPEYI
ncbi:hypothetical protein MKZ38_006130 [Zalerion maritima]|uniref:Uncharacterized protein n=1 Tax=Zalerion maritima TaxID=339359 RepID=A0AAD5RJI4_9PEZI|nr:hypothetical protein MKZ38_006130 [Zalerion maritima]